MQSGSKQSAQGFIHTRMQAIEAEIKIISASGVLVKMDLSHLQGKEWFSLNILLSLMVSPPLQPGMSVRNAKVARNSFKHFGYNLHVY